MSALSRLLAKKLLGAVDTPTDESRRKFMKGAAGAGVAAAAGGAGMIKKAVKTPDVPGVSGLNAKTLRDALDRTAAVKSRLNLPNLRGLTYGDLRSWLSGPNRYREDPEDLGFDLAKIKAIHMLDDSEHPTEVLREMEALARELNVTVNPKDVDDNLSRYAQHTEDMVSEYLSYME